MEPEARVALVYQPWQGRILTVELLGQMVERKRVELLTSACKADIIPFN